MLYHVRIVNEKGEGCILSVKGRTEWKTKACARRHAEGLTLRNFGAVKVELRNEFNEVLETVQDLTPATITTDELSACTDCLMVVEGCTDTVDADREGEIMVAIKRHTDAGQTLHGGDRIDEFSARPCQLCGSTLAGERHAITIIDHATKGADAMKKTLTATIQFFDINSAASLKTPPTPELYKCFSALSDAKDRASAEGLQTVEIELDTLFDNQFNTTDGRRLFDWWVALKVHGSGKVGAAGWGHWLTPESLQALNAIRARRHVCGYCGFQTDTPESSHGWCPKCRGSQYLEQKDLYLLRLLPVTESGKRNARQPGEVPPELVQDWEALKADYASKQGERLQTERERFIKDQEKAHAKIDRQTAVYLAIYDAGIDPRKTGAVYYDHTDSVQFGAITRLTDEQAAEIETKAKAAAIPCAWSVKRGA